MTTIINIDHLRGALTIAPKKDPRKYLNAVRVEATARHVLTVATDGAALVAAWGENSTGDTGAWTVPRDTVEAALRAASKDCTFMTIVTRDDGSLALDADTGSFPFVEVDERYPDWRQIWPLETLDPAEAPAPEINPSLLATVQKAIATAADVKGPRIKDYSLAVRPHGSGNINSAAVAHGRARHIAAVVMPMQRQKSEHIAPPEQETNE